MNEVFNLLIAGVGGQGVLTLSNAIRSLCELSGFPWQSATFKGGAQRLGSIHTEMRMVFNHVNRNMTFSSQLPKGSLHLLMALEPWEALRFAEFCNRETVAVVNCQVQPLYVERFGMASDIDPIRELESILKTTEAFDFSGQSLKQFGTDRMVNFLILRHVLKTGRLPFRVLDAEVVFENLTKIRNHSWNQSRTGV